jgi:hypothetical protein
LHPFLIFPGEDTPLSNLQSCRLCKEIAAAIASSFSQAKTPPFQFAKLQTLQGNSGSYCLLLFSLFLFFFFCFLYKEAREIRVGTAGLQFIFGGSNTQTTRRVW